jgi:hypothetical protein
MRQLTLPEFTAVVTRECPNLTTEEQARVSQAHAWSSATSNAVLCAAILDTARRAETGSDDLIPNSEQYQNAVVACLVVRGYSQANWPSIADIKFINRCRELGITPAICADKIVANSHPAQSVFGGAL